MTEEKTILAVFAHPDDEVFGIGGTLVQYSRQGVRIVLVCATRGEVGEIAEGTSATPETLGQVREAELHCAAEILGINEVKLLDYRDSGMVGTPENEDPRAFMNAPADEVVKRLVGIIRKLRPQVVITFDPQGVYGHPDHIAAHQHTLTAFEAAGDGQRYADEGMPWMPDRLFYSVILRSQIEKMRDQMKAAGKDTNDFENMQEQGTFGWPDELVNLRLDALSAVEAKQKAFECHQTQFGDSFFSEMPEAELRELIRYEYLALARPEPANDLMLDDLFEL